MNYDYAVLVQSDDVPNGYFPVGDEKHLEAYCHKASDQGITPEVYKLTQQPQFTKTETIVGKGLESLVSGQKEITLSTKDVSNYMQNITLSGRSALSQATNLASKAITNKKLPNAMEILPVVAPALAIKSDLQKAYSNTVGVVNDVFMNRETDDFICKDGNYFVSQAWLENSQNATKFGHVKSRTISFEKA